MIEFRGVSSSTRLGTVLRDVDLEVKRGQSSRSWTVRSGKTTLSTCCRLLRADAREILRTGCR